MKAKRIRKGKPVGAYRGFVLMYRNWFFGVLGALRLLPRTAIVIETSNKGKGRKLKVPVNKGVSNNYPRVFLAEGYNLLFKVVKVYGDQVLRTAKKDTKRKV